MLSREKSPRTLKATGPCTIMRTREARGPESELSAKDGGLGQECKKAAAPRFHVYVALCLQKKMKIETDLFKEDLLQCLENLNWSQLQTAAGGMANSRALP